MANGETIKALKTFVTERNWEQFHSSQNLAKSIAIEAGELLECYQWQDETNIERVKEELADVISYCLLLADKQGFDVDEIVMEKLARNSEKYPVEKSWGKSTKYDEL
jgi:NTP pyrophosphatase (non-canonical NTP hydrolase)